MFKIATGASDDIDTDVATQQALDSALEGLGGAKPAAAFVLAGTEFDHQVMVDQLMDALGDDVPLVGCTTAGQFAEDTGFADDAVSVMLFASDTIQFAGALSHISAGLREAGRDVATQLRTQLGADPQFGLLAPESQGFNHDEVLGGLTEVLGTHAPFVGGTCGVRPDGSGSAQFFGRQVLQGAIPALGLGGDVLVGTGAGSGWKAFGDKRTVTRAEGCVVYEIDGVNAYDLMVEQFGGFARAVAAEYPLAVHPDPSTDEFYLRAIMAMDESSRSLVFAAEVPLGSTIRLTSITSEDMLAGAEASVAEARRNYPGEAPAGLFVVSCVARKWIMGINTMAEHQALQRSAGALPVSGFYSSGEIGPIRSNGALVFHNETCISLALGQS
ncbi:MAG: FIST signal transduction protein [Myxococcota bacterium]